MRRGRADEAVDWLRRALEAYGRALEGRPNDPTILDERARAAVALADLLNRLGRPAEAVEPLVRAEEELSTVLARDPGAGRLKPTLARLVRARARGAGAAGPDGEAADAWSRAEALDPATSRRARRRR